MLATVTIDRELCKGCALCVPVCPPKVLIMSDAVNSKGYRYPLLKEGCTGCELCAKVCPDFCFEVYREATLGSPLPLGEGQGEGSAQALSQRNVPSPQPSPTGRGRQTEVR